LLSQSMVAGQGRRRSAADRLSRRPHLRGARNLGRPQSLSQGTELALIRQAAGRMTANLRKLPRRESTAAAAIPASADLSARCFDSVKVVVAFLPQSGVPADARSAQVSHADLLVVSGRHTRDMLAWVN